MENQIEQIKFLRQKEITQITGLSRTTIHVYVKRKMFPAPVILSARCIRWIDFEVKAWMKSKADAPRDHLLGGEPLSKHLKTIKNSI